MARERVFVAMSGGVDSSVAALLLKEAGYDVTGFTMLVWDTPNVILSEPQGEAKNLNSSTCLPSGTAPQLHMDDARHACLAGRQVADLLGIPHHVLDIRDEFKRIVVDYFTRSYLAGETPNPCVVCNQRIKFGLMFEKMRELGLDLLATGHYARLIPKDDRTLLCEAKDRAKSQAYFLAMLRPDVLQHCLFPIGEYSKTEVRAIARRAHLPVHERRESQEICFIPDNDCAAFIEQFAPIKHAAGAIRDTAGNPVGRHKGYYHYTIGQRRRLGSSFGSPRYVVKIVPEKNAIVIGEKKDLYRTTLTVRDVNWIALDTPPDELRADVRIRYRSRPAPATLLTDGERMRVEFDEPQCAVTPGQLAVFNAPTLSGQAGDVVLGAGWIV